MKFVQDKTDPEIIWVRAKICRRCGGIITSAGAMENGYGHHCLSKMVEEADRQKQIEGQACLFGNSETD